MRSFRFITVCCYGVLAILLLLSSTLSATAKPATDFTANVMAPLLVEDWEQFRAQLLTAKQIGVDGVSVDVWWGLVEAEGDQQFDWHYYDRIFTEIQRAGLKIVPIMAFHQCGGNVGDDCDIPLPPWIWTHFAEQGVDKAQLQYKSEYGNASVETISLWADALVLPQYHEFMRSFAIRYAALVQHISEINISMGPAGELRYPSYNSHDGDKTRFPGRGGFQAYSDQAQADFRRAMAKKYHSIEQLNRHWQTSHLSFDSVAPPADTDAFIASGVWCNTGYGRDFIHWYHQALLQHGQRMLDTALSAFDTALAEIELGFKIPGIHWKIAATDYSRRSAELAAGLIGSETEYTAENGFGYAAMVGLAAQYADEPRGIVLHFTALEMSDQPESDSQSLAQSLVYWLGAEAQRQQVRIKGENALAAGVTHAYGWNNIDSIFANSHYSGMTVLRINQVTDGGIGQQRYQQLIGRLKQQTAINSAVVD